MYYNINSLESGSKNLAERSSSMNLAHYSGFNGFELVLLDQATRIQDN